MRQHITAVAIALALASGGTWWYYRSRHETFTPVYCSTRNSNACTDLGSRESAAYSQ